MALGKGRRDCGLSALGGYGVSACGCPLRPRPAAFRFRAVVRVFLSSLRGQPAVLWAETALRVVLRLTGFRRPRGPWQPSSLFSWRLSSRGVVLSASDPVLLGAGLTAGLVWDGLSAAVPAKPELLGSFAPVFGRLPGSLFILMRSLPGAFTFPLLFRCPLDPWLRDLLWRSGFWL